MNGFDILDAQIKALFSDINHYWHKWVWDNPVCRWATYVVVFLPSFLYFVISLSWIFFGLWHNDIDLFLRLLFITGLYGWLAFWSIRGMARELRRFWSFWYCRWVIYVVAMLPALIMSVYLVVGVNWKYFRQWQDFPVLLRLIGVLGITGWFVWWSIRGMIREVNKKR